MQMLKFMIEGVNKSEESKDNNKYFESISSSLERAIGSFDTSDELFINGKFFKQWKDLDKDSFLNLIESIKNKKTIGKHNEEILIKISFRQTNDNSKLSQKAPDVDVNELNIGKSSFTTLRKIDDNISEVWKYDFSTYGNVVDGYCYNAIDFNTAQLVDKNLVENYDSVYMSDIISSADEIDITKSHYARELADYLNADGAEE